ncbi:hypothetical protein Tco_1476255 [Tanacetum coccineum]
MGTNRTNKSYVDGVAAFIDYAVHNLQKIRNINLRVNKRHLLIPCPCTKCLNHIEHKVEEIQFHLFKNGINLSYTNWTRHGKKDEPSISALEPVNPIIEFVDDTDFALDIPTYGPATVEMVNATKDNFDEDDLVKFQELLLDAEKPLMKDVLTSQRLIKKMISAGNEMVEKTYQAKKVMKLMGSGYKKIHVCINNCLLYWKDDKDLTACRTCGISRWKVDNKTHKVYENIPAKAWRTIDEKFPEIAEDPRNLRLGISADGVDVNTGNRHHRVDTYDVSTKDNFNLRAVVLWTINDYPALGTLCGCPYSGFKGCVVCGKDTNCVRLSASSKQKKNVAESIVGTLLHVPGKTKDGLNARLDLAELGVKPELFAMQDEDKTTLPPAGGERELAIDKESVSETIRWISYGPRATVVKYDAYNINGYIFRTKCHDGKVYQNSGVSIEVNHKSGGVKRDRTWVVHCRPDNLGQKLIPFTPPKNYKDTYDEVDEEFSTVIHHRNDNVLPLVDRRDLANESRDDYYRKDCRDIEKDKACMLAKAQASETSSKAKVEACGSKAKLQASTKTLIVKSPVPITNCVLRLANAKTRDAIKGKTFGVKIQWLLLEEKIEKRKLRSG